MLRASAGFALLMVVAFSVFTMLQHDQHDQHDQYDKELATEWNVDPNNVAEARKLAKASGHADSIPVMFLFAKGVENAFADSSGQAAKHFDLIKFSRFDLIINPPNKHWRECRERLDRILQEGGDNTADTVPSNVMSFESAIKKMPEWGGEDAFIFHQRKEIPAVQRWQRSGLCYIHAAEVVQYYLVALHDKGAGMIDMAKMIRQTFHHEALESHIFAKGGGSSHNMLERILMPDSIIAATESELAHAKLDKFGPLLVSGFAVHKDFLSKTKFSLDGQPVGEVRGHHAMTIIGHRKDGDGKVWYLVQNWWSGMQFVEMTAEYLKACRATLYFVETPQTEIPKKFPVQHHRFAENENVDKPENMNFAEPECPPPQT